jgi:formylglycine-generating enzyme required for sulfatase activity
MALTLRRTPRTAQGYVEPLLAVGDALPLHMLLVPGGTFLMGQTEAEKAELIRQVGEEDYKKYYGRELPQHEVTVPQFFMGRYPVTQAQWRVVAAMPQVKSELQPDPSRFKGDNRPVERVNWYDAVEFCARLSAHTSRQYRLPSEAEWEYACRAGTTTPFYFGNTLTTEVANYDGNSTYADGPKGEYREETTPVDHFGIANAFGLCDMHGNVDEWCQDHFHSDYKGAPTDGSAWVEGGNSERRILRGGSWGGDPRYCRSAYRADIEPGYDYGYYGFRVVCSAPRTL